LLGSNINYAQEATQARLAGLEPGFLHAFWVFKINPGTLIIDTTLAFYNRDSFSLLAYTLLHD
jgi:hypothetical protein